MAAAAADLSLTDAQAKKLVNLAIEHGAYSDEMPDTKKGRTEAAVEAVEYCIDSWVNDGVRPDDDDEDIAAAGEAILTIFEAAGIEVDEDGDIQVAGEEDDDEPEATGDDEAPFDPDDYFENGYTELTAASKLKALNELDLEDEDTVAIIVQVKDWEEEQAKPASRVLNWIEENVELEEPEAEADEDDDDPEPEGDGEDEEPWDGYDGANAVDIKKFLDEAMESDDGLTVEQLQYVKEYEEARKQPRKRILDKVDELIATVEEGEEPAKPAKKALGKKAPAAAAKKAPAKKAAAKKVETNGQLTISINGEEIVECDAASLLEVVGRIAAEIEGGAETVNIEAG